MMESHPSAKRASRDRTAVRGPCDLRDAFNRPPDCGPVVPIFLGQIALTTQGIALALADVDPVAAQRQTVFLNDCL